MPRGPRKTITGAKAQPLVSTPEQAYGAGVDQMAMQRAMPLPQQPQVAAAPAQTAAVAPRRDPAALLAAAAAMKGNTGLLTAPSSRPNEPVTAGLSRGPGPGPQALGVDVGSPTGNLMRRLSAITGDPYAAQLADRAGI